MLKLILCYLLWLPMIATGQIVLKAARLDSCNSIPLYQYHQGMVFYFPLKTPSIARRETLPLRDYIYTGKEPMMTSRTYSSVAGRSYEIIGLIATQTIDVNQIKHTVTTIKLEEKNVRDTIYYELPPDAFELSKQELENGRVQTFSIKGAIFQDNIRFASKLTATKAYALFALNGRKFQQVTFIDVKPGSWETPVRLNFQYTDQKGKNVDSSMEVVICGTNTISSFKKSFDFNVFFSYKNPRDGIDIPDSFWQALTEGKPMLGMTSDWTLLALGKPSKTLEEETTDGKLEQYIYTKGYHLYFKNGKIVKIEKSS